MITIEEYAKMVDAMDTAQQKYFDFKRKHHLHNQELFEASKNIDKEVRKTTKMILAGENVQGLF